MDLTENDLDSLTAWTLIRVAHRLEQQLRELFAAEGLSPVQFGVLAHLATGAALTRAELARAVLVRPQSIAGVLDGLIAGGLIAQQGQGGKGRRNPVSLTVRGQELLQRVWPMVSTANEAGHLGISVADAGTLNRILLTMLAPPA